MKFDIQPEEERKNRRRKKENKKLYIIIVLTVSLITMIILIFIVSSSKNKTAVVENPIPSPSLIPAASPETDKEIKVVDINSDERPIAVMIDSDIENSNHAGLQESYLNYEILIEDGLTRIMAIYKDNNPSLIGPIRSAREYFLDYAEENDAIFTYYGWSPYTKSDISDLTIDEIDGTEVSEVFRRDTKSTAPHNVFTRMSYIKQYLSKSSITSVSNEWQLLKYSTSTVDLNDGDYIPKSATKIEIPYSKKEYRNYSYDETNEYYLRFTNGLVQSDRKTNKQIHYKNIIIQKVPTKVTDNKGKISLETTGSGKAYYITNGYFLPINWSKKSKNVKTKYTYANGKEVEFNDGNTIIQIVPVDCDLSIE